MSAVNSTDVAPARSEGAVSQSVSAAEPIVGIVIPASKKRNAFPDRGRLSNRTNLVVFVILLRVRA
jgi:hypothetical protein